MSPKNPSRSFSRAFSVARSELKYTYFLKSVNRPGIDKRLGILGLTIRQHKEKRDENEVMRHRSELNKNIQLSHLRDFIMDSFDGGRHYDHRNNWARRFVVAPIR